MEEKDDNYVAVCKRFLFNVLYWLENVKI